MVAHYGTAGGSDAHRHRGINSVFVSDLTKGQGGAILLMECTNLKKVKTKKEN